MLRWLLCDLNHLAIWITCTSSTKQDVHVIQLYRPPLHSAPTLQLPLIQSSAHGWHISPSRVSRSQTHRFTAVQIMAVEIHNMTAMSGGRRRRGATEAREQRATHESRGRGCQYRGYTEVMVINMQQFVWRRIDFMITGLFCRSA